MQPSAPFFFNCFQREASQIHSSGVFFFFFLCGSTTHSSYYPPLPLPIPSPHPLPSQTLGLGSFPNPAWFSLKEPSRSSCCKPHISKATSSSKPLGCCESRKKNNKIPQRITNIPFPHSADLVKNQDVPIPKFMGSASLRSTA